MLLDLGLLVARLAVAPMFVVAGWRKLIGWPPQQVIRLLEREELPYPTLLAAGTVALELVAPALLVLGVLTRWAAGALAIFTVWATWIAHRWWTFPPAEQVLQTGIALKNIAVAGLLILLALAGSGRFALRRD
ncbi:DoxX family protein [Elioraea thermophila]|uniref:DoxX family protein n=1 Tax=Elioraea thermophila TaxID=2185104 RepID=UPI000DF38B0F|nr:DoxX family protein [Elioraea thermophila]